MDSDVTVPVSTCQLFSFWRQSDAPDCLFNILCFSLFYLFKINFLCKFGTFLVSFEWFCFEYIETLTGLIVTICNKYNFTHILAICISEQTFLDFVLVGGLNHLVVDEMPESDCSITCTGNESCQTRFILKTV